METIRSYLFYGYGRKDTGKVVYIGKDVTGLRGIEHAKRLLDGSEGCRLLKEAYEREPDVFEYLELDRQRFTKSAALKHEKHLIARYQTYFPDGCNWTGYTAQYDAGRPDATERMLKRAALRAAESTRRKTLLLNDYWKRRRVLTEANLARKKANSENAARYVGRAGR
jgi:hypothetical protein